MSWEKWKWFNDSHCTLTGSISRSCSPFRQAWLRTEGLVGPHEARVNRVKNKGYQKKRKQTHNLGWCVSVSTYLCITLIIQASQLLSIQENTNIYIHTWLHKDQPPWHTQKKWTSNLKSAQGDLDLLCTAAACSWAKTTSTIFLRMPGRWFRSTKYPAWNIWPGLWLKILCLV